MARGKRRKRRTPEPGDPAGVAQARAELRASQARLDQATREVTAPLAFLRQRNNVTGMVDRLMHEIVSNPHE